MAKNDKDVILVALRKEREDIHQKLMQIDRIIKRVANVDYSDETELNELPIKSHNSTPEITQADVFPSTADLRVQVLRVFDVIRKASKLKDVQSEYAKLSGNNYNIRETVRSLQKSKLIKIMRENNAERGIFWVKSEWLENGQLMDEFKPIGFDMIYKAENITFE